MVEVRGTAIQRRPVNLWSLAVVRIFEIFEIFERAPYLEGCPCESERNASLRCIGVPRVNQRTRGKREIGCGLHFERLHQKKGQLLVCRAEPGFLGHIPGDLAEVSIQNSVFVFWAAICGILDLLWSSTGGATGTVSAWYETRFIWCLIISKSLFQLTSWVRLRLGILWLHLGSALVVHEWQGPGERNTSCTSEFGSSGTTSLGESSSYGEGNRTGREKRESSQVAACCFDSAAFRGIFGRV